MEERIKQFLDAYKGANSNETGKAEHRKFRPYKKGHQAIYYTVGSFLFHKKADILDIGSGIGVGYEILREHYYRGVDPDIRCIDYCSEKYPHAYWAHSDWLNFKVKKPADFALCVEVIEHIDGKDWIQFLRKIRNNTKLGLFLSTPNPERSSHGCISSEDMKEILNLSGFNTVALEWHWTTLYVCELNKSMG